MQHFPLQKNYSMQLHYLIWYSYLIIIRLSAFVDAYTFKIRMHVNLLKYNFKCHLWYLHFNLNNFNPKLKCYHAIKELFRMLKINFKDFFYQKLILKYYQYYLYPHFADLFHLLNHNHEPINQNLFFVFFYVSKDNFNANFCSFFYKKFIKLL